MAEWYDKTRKGFQEAMSVPQTDGITRLIRMMAGASQPTPKPVPNYGAIPLTPSPFSIPYTGLRNEPAPPPMPPAMNLGALPPTNADAQQMDEAARYRPQPQPAPPTPASMPSMPPVNVQAPAPAVDTYADLGGYGGSPGMTGRPVPAPQQYSHLNPTPSLEEIFRREYAANPGAFGKIG